MYLKVYGGFQQRKKIPSPGAPLKASMKHPTLPHLSTAESPLVRTSVSSPKGMNSPAESIIPAEYCRYQDRKCLEAPQRVLHDHEELLLHWEEEQRVIVSYPVGDTLSVVNASVSGPQL